MIKIKLHESTHNVVVAVADAELIGKRFETEKLQLEVNNIFYDGETLTEAQAEEKMRQLKERSYSFNIVGERAVQLAIKLKIIDEQNVIKIEGVPHALSFSI